MKPRKGMAVLYKGAWGTKKPIAGKITGYLGYKNGKKTYGVTYKQGKKVDHRWGYTSQFRKLTLNNFMVDRETKALALDTKRWYEKQGYSVRIVKKAPKMYYVEMRV
jgi:hypothetical protein